MNAQSTVCRERTPCSFTEQTHDCAAGASSRLYVLLPPPLWFYPLSGSIPVILLAMNTSQHAVDDIIKQALEGVVWDKEWGGGNIPPPLGHAQKQVGRHEHYCFSSRTNLTSNCHTDFLNLTSNCHTDFRKRLNLKQCYLCVKCY